MKNFEEMYSSKLTSADELAGRFENGWNIGMDIGTSQTPGIMTALANRAKKRKYDRAACAVYYGFLSV